MIPREVSPRDVFIGGPAAWSGREARFICFGAFGQPPISTVTTCKTCKGSVLSWHSRSRENVPLHTYRTTQLSFGELSS